MEKSKYDSLWNQPFHNGSPCQLGGVLTAYLCGCWSIRNMKFWKYTKQTFIIFFLALLHCIGLPVQCRHHEIEVIEVNNLTLSWSYGEGIQSFTIRCEVSSRFFLWMLFFRLRKLLSTFGVLSDFFFKYILNFSNAYSAFIELILFLSLTL